jgi:hypothetical protein
LLRLQHIDIWEFYRPKIVLNYLTKKNKAYPFA